uniref:Fe2OG dioxygenase domain-containing protein n=1 Tax=Emiliania huxleyi TaxID=2903 RepID=A0A7S3WA22_EMIHU
MALQYMAEAPLPPGLEGAQDWARDYAAANPSEAFELLFGRPSPETLPALVIPQLLSPEEVKQCFSAGSEVGSSIEPFATSSWLCAALRATPHDIGYSGEHVALYLHKGGYLQTKQPALCDKLLHSMRRQPGNWGDPALALQVRCIELHTYAVGGGLLEPGHRDNGSKLSMSVLLSDAATTGLEGGQIVTWSGGEPVVHELRRGDALLFHSGKAHNVATVTSGMRQSLVIELWVGPTNTKDRES